MSVLNEAVPEGSSPVADIPKGKATGGCKTCHDLDTILKIIETKYSKFESKKTLETFNEPVIDIQGNMVSFDELMKNFVEENPTWKKDSMSVPTSLLMKFMKKVPYYLTEDDARDYLNGEFLKAMKIKKEVLNSPEMISFIGNILNRFKDGQMSKDDTVAQLNLKIFDIIFVGEDIPTECKACKKGKCKKLSCPVKRGFKSKSEVVKDLYTTHLWPDLLEKADKSEDITKFAEKKMTESLNQYFQNNPKFSLLANMRGQKSENNIVSLLQSQLDVDGAPSLLISSYKVFTSLKNLLKSYNIKLKRSLNDNKQQEHDIVTFVPVDHRVRAHFTQAKTTVKIPWPHEGDRTANIVSSCKKAFSQIIGDLETFQQLMEFFLTKEQFEKIDLNFSVSVTSLDDVPEEDICKKCRKYIYEESKVYSPSEEREVFGNNDFIPPTEDCLEIFKTLSTLYVGGASIVELKAPKDGYFEEVKRMNLVCQGMKELISQEGQCKDEMITMVKLGPEQNSIFMSKLQSFTVIAPWGGGKTMLLELELRRTISDHNKSKEPVHIFLVVYEMKATSLLKHYQSVVDDLEKKNNIKVKVMNLADICNELSIQYENRSTTSVINDLCETLSEEVKGKTYLFLDEVVVENPEISSPEELLGKIPFVLDNDVFPWSELDSNGVNLMVCVNPESQDLVQLQSLDTEAIASLKMSKPNQGTVPTLAMFRVFRSSNAIQHFLQEVEVECSKEHREFGYLIPPGVVRQGHEIQGERPTWVEVAEHQHMKCPKPNCSDCFLVAIKGSFDSTVEQLTNDGIPNKDILVILSASASTKNSRISFGKDFLRSTYPNLIIRSNFEFDGCEEKVVIVIRNGGLLSFSLSSAISRAVSKLILFIPDDHCILERCVKKGLLDKKRKCLETLSDCLASSKTSQDNSLQHIPSSMGNLQSNCPEVIPCHSSKDQPTHISLLEVTEEKMPSQHLMITLTPDGKICLSGSDNIVSAVNGDEGLLTKLEMVMKENNGEKAASEVFDCPLLPCSPLPAQSKEEVDDMEIDYNGDEAENLEIISDDEVLTKDNSMMGKDQNMPADQNFAPVA